MSEGKELQQIIDQTLQLSHGILAEYQPEIEAQNIGSVHFVEKGVALVSGLSHVRSDELIRFAGNRLGIAFNLDPDEIGVILLDNSEDIDVSADVVRAGRVVDVPVGEELKGRIVDPIGRPLDEKGPLKTRKRRPVERPAPAIMDRLPVEVPLQTGIKAIDALIPIGRGQRELIIGDRQTGKTAIALDTIINQRDKNVLCIYCSIGQKNSDVVKFISKLRDNDALSYTIIVVGSGEDPPGLQYVAPYAAMSIGEYFMERGEDVLVVFDDLTRHARVYRELSLLLRRPPAREAYPGDIFYIHSRLLERSTNVKEEKGGGSITALPIVETQAQNISAYIPTNLISITDGQIYLSPELHRKGILPAIDIGKSVSRV
ncbi:MAG: F0F1 ATP synthase subunit alpha, partial [Calditrichaeota bacterium]